MTLFFKTRAEDRQALPVSLRRQLHGLSGRVPGYVLLLGTILRRRNMPVAYSRALVQEAGFGRLPVRVPGRMLPGFRRLGKVAVLGVLLHMFLGQRGLGARNRGRFAAGLSVDGLRDDLRTILAIAHWVLSGQNGKRSRRRSEGRSIRAVALRRCYGALLCMLLWNTRARLND